MLKNVTILKHKVVVVANILLWLYKSLVIVDSTNVVYIDFSVY